MKNTIIVILILIILGFCTYEIIRKPDIIKDTVIKTTTSYDTTYIETHDTVLKYVPKYIVKYDTSWIDKDIDSAEVFREYFSSVVMDDTVINDSALMVIVHDSISRNRVQSRWVEDHRNYPVYTITKTNIVEHNEFYWEAYLGQEFGLGIDYEIGQNRIGFAYGTDGWKVRYGRTIKLNKRK